MRNQNQTRTSLLLALLATGVLATGTLLAEPGDGKRMRIVHFDGMLEMADANGDGNISRAEHDAMRAAHLAELDANNDGFVTYAEHKAAMEARAQARFTKRHDKNGDGRVSVDEMAEHGGGMFERMDADGDGMVTAEELRQGHRGMRFKREHKGQRAPAR